MVALTYLGSERAVPKYNVMGVAKAALESAVRYLASELGEKGIRVNGLSAGPIKTLAARGIKDFNSRCSIYTPSARPLRRNVDVEEVADTALFLCSRTQSRHHRRDSLRRWRLSNHGDVIDS